MGKKKVQPAPTASTSGSTSGGGGDYNTVLSGYRDFATTGGFSPEDLANIRARAVSPIRAVYANAQMNLNRQRALQGGYSPGFQAAMSRMSREQSMSQADAAVNREAELAQQIREGKLAGLQGLMGAIGSGGGGGGGGGQQVAEEPKKGFWSKFGGVAKKVGQVALPIAMNYIAPGSGLIAGAAGAGALGKLSPKGIGTNSSTRANIPGLITVPRVQPARR